MIGSHLWIRSIYWWFLCLPYSGLSYFLRFFEECELSCEQLRLFRIIVGFIGIGVGRNKAEASHLLIALTMFRFYFKSFICLAAPVMRGKKKNRICFESTTLYWKGCKFGLRIIFSLQSLLFIVHALIINKLRWICNFSLVFYLSMVSIELVMNRFVLV